jgi:tetratricopeptide (TPR) repeat protein
MNWLVLGYLDPTSGHLATAEGSGRWVAMKNAVDLTPQSALFQYEYGKNVQFRPRAKDEPADAFKRAIELNPGHYRAYLNLAYAATDGTDVEALYQKVVDIAPNFLEGRIAAGSYYAALDEIEKAETQYMAAAAANPKYDVAEFRLGLLMLQAERPQQAERFFIRVVELSPGSFEAHYYLGNIASDRKDYDEALRQYSEAVSQRTNYVEAEYGIGWAHRQQGRIESALSQFDRVIRMLPSGPNAYVARADIRVEQMNFAGALADYQKAIEAFKTQIQGLTASIAALETRSSSRAAIAEKRRHEREKATAALSLAAARQAKSSIEQAAQGR